MENNTTYVCGYCNKYRMIRPLGYSFDPEETVTIKARSGADMTIPKERCSYCDIHIVNKYLKPANKTSPIDLRELLNEEQSLEELL